MIYKYKLHLLPNGDTHEIEYELAKEDEWKNSLPLFVDELKNQHPDLSCKVKKGKLLDSDGAEIGPRDPQSFQSMAPDADLYLRVPDSKGMFKLIK